MSGVTAIVWKEWREVLLPNGRPGRQLLGLLGIQLAIPLVFGLLFGQEPELWAISIGVFMGMVPIYTVLSYVIDSFAGERERHTLETLLVTRLTDSAILTGKLLSLLSFGFVFGAAGLVILLIVGPLFVGTGFYFGIALVSFLVAFIGAMHYAVIASLIGILISMRVKTVRGGQQIFAFAAIMPAIIVTSSFPAFIGTGVVGAEGIGQYVVIFGVVAAIVMYALMALLFVVALRLFRRDRLLAR